MTEFCAFARDASGAVSVRIEAANTGAARRLLIDASYGMCSLDDIDHNDNIPAGPLAEAGEAEAGAPVSDGPSATANAPAAGDTSDAAQTSGGSPATVPFASGATSSATSDGN